MESQERHVTKRDVSSRNAFARSSSSFDRSFASASGAPRSSVALALMVARVRMTRKPVVILLALVVFPSGCRFVPITVCGACHGPMACPKPDRYGFVATVVPSCDSGTHGQSKGSAELSPCRASPSSRTRSNSSRRFATCSDGWFAISERRITIPWVE